MLHPTPYILTLHPTPYTLHPTPYTLHPTPCTLHPAPDTLVLGSGLHGATYPVLDPRDPLLRSERTQGFDADPDYWKGEVFAYVELPQNLKDLKDRKPWTPGRPGYLSVVNKELSLSLSRAAVDVG